MSNRLRQIKRNQLELAGLQRNYKRYETGNKERFDTVKNKLNAIGRNDLPENHHGNIQKQVVKMMNEEIHHLD